MLELSARLTALATKGDPRFQKEAGQLDNTFY